MDSVAKDRLYCHVRMATGQDSVGQKFVEECSELIKEISSLQVSVMKGEQLDDGDIKNTIGEIADFLSTLEQVTGERESLTIIGIELDAKLDRLHKRAIDGELKTNMAWQR